jgi:hypothetical protein
MRLMPKTPRSPIPILPPVKPTLQKPFQRRRKNSRHLPRVQNRNKRLLRIRTQPRLRVVAVKERDAGTHHQLRFGKIGRHLAEMLHVEREWELPVDVGQADLLTCLAPRRLEGGFGRKVCSAWVG